MQQEESINYYRNLTSTENAQTYGFLHVHAETFYQ